MDVEEETYKVKTTGFEGPFGLLLDLVEKRKLFINDVSLATVTEDFLAHMNQLGGLTPREVTSFVLVASTLILIKSKSLLPNLNLTDEEQGDIKDLEERLRLYKLYIKLGGNIKSNFGKSIIFAPLERKNNVLVFLPDEQISKDSMMAFARNVLGSMPKKVFLPEVEVRKVISIEEIIDKLTERIQDAMKMNFSEFAGKAPGKQYTREEKVHVIVSFLAMLELVRNGILDAVQGSHSEDIIISKQEEEITNELGN
ncbi:MAG TPA: ScpA family protein [Candidatus Paceibacterota bacterium]|jgi:segregation and condensation protein A|nr:ScpA family protein [Candidatus Paceibacterota bacterium]